MNKTCGHLPGCWTWTAESGRLYNAFLLDMLDEDGARFRACLAGLNLKSWSSLTSAPASRLRRMTLRACRSMIVGQLKSWEPSLTVGTQAGGCLRKRNSAKQALSSQS